MRAFKFGVRSIAIQIAIAAMWTLPMASRGQIFVSVGYPSGTIAEYATSGTLLNPDLISAYDATAGSAAMGISGPDLFVSTYNSTSNISTIAEYTFSGTTVNASVISGNLGPFAVSGSDLFIVNEAAGTIGEYTTSGATVNSSLVSGLPLNAVSELVVSGSDLFTLSSGTQTVIGEYTTSGAAVNNALIDISNDDNLMAVSGSDVFVTHSNTGTISEYATSGTLVNSSLVSGLYSPEGIAASGSDLFVTNFFSTSGPGGTIGEYTTSGSTVNASLVSGLDHVSNIAVAEDVPEPVSFSLLLLGGVSLLNRRRRIC